MKPRQAIVHAQWETLWLIRKNGENRIIAYDCGGDYAEAKRMYLKVLKAGRHFPTLRCKNVGFPPPERFREKMNAYNRQRGIFWCCFCVELRKFEKRDGWDDEGIYVHNPHFACPICDVPHTHPLIMRFNPLFTSIANRTGRRSSGSRRKSGKQRKTRS